MEVFAGYTEHADTQAGRLLNALDDMGVRENTLIFCETACNFDPHIGVIGVQK